MDLFILKEKNKQIQFNFNKIAQHNFHKIWRV